MEKHTKDGGLFLGSKKVVGYVENPEINLVGVLLEDDTNLNLTVRQWEGAKSETPYPDNEISVRRFKEPKADIIAAVTATHEDLEGKELLKKRADAVKEILLAERADLNSFGWMLDQALSDLQEVFQKVEEDVKASYRLAVAKVFGTIATEGILLTQIHEVLMDSDIREGSVAAGGVYAEPTPEQVGTPVETEPTPEVDLAPEDRPDVETAPVVETGDVVMPETTTDTGVETVA